MFPPELNTQLHIRDRTYTIAEHPMFEGMPYGQEGRQGTVYKLLSLDGGPAIAMKIFRPSFRQPAIMMKLEQMSELSQIAGLQVCSREVLYPQRDMDLLSLFPELLYGVLMPWVEGSTWSDILHSRSELTVEQCRTLALNFAGMLAEMEQRGVAHSDLSSSNVILSGLSQQITPTSGITIELVDVEDLFAEGLNEPDYLPEGKTGYTAAFAGEDVQWGIYNSRFAGAIMLCEMLAWSDPEIVQCAWGDSYFDPNEMQQECERYSLMHRTLEQTYGMETAGLLARVWNAKDLPYCPSFGEWVLVLTAAVATQVPVVEKNENSLLEEHYQEQDESRDVQQSTQLEMSALPDVNMNEGLAKARQLEGQGKLPSALWEYGKLIGNFPESSSIRKEIEIAMASVQDLIDQSFTTNERSSSPIRNVFQKEGTSAGEALYRNVWIMTLIISAFIIVLAWILYIFNNL